MRGFGQSPRAREAIESAYAEAATQRAHEALLLEVLLDLRDLTAECAWRLSDLLDQDQRR